ncbi:MAG: hypothetical protein QY331_06810 [Melioribacteraceae bacterium]|nr:MAG: hypothetical protein QY331_06810 [Melioribacteraceae bacterium]
MISSKEISRQYDIGDPYLHFNGPVCEGTPKDLLPYLDTIRKESEWKVTSLKVVRTDLGKYKTIVKNDLHFGFTPLVMADESELKAIETSKKVSSYPSIVFPFIQLGCKYSDFPNITEDVIFYCDGMLSLEKKDLKSALVLIEKAYELNSSEPLYASLYFHIRLKLDDRSVVTDELNYFQNDIDSLIHTERIYTLIRFVSKNRHYKEALELIDLVNRKMDDLIEGNIKNRIYSSQRTDFYEYKKEQFNRKIDKAKQRYESYLQKEKAT